MKITAIIQARQNSTRFPNKVMKKILNRPIIDLLIERVKRSKFINDIVIAIPKSKINKSIYNFCKKKKYNVFRGSSNNVLKRYYFAAKKNNSKIIVRLTADNPLIDYKIIDKTIKHFFNKKVDYCSNTNPNPNNYPDGMDVEVFDFKTLEKTYKSAILPSEKEHVTFYMWKTKLFKTSQPIHKIDYSKFRLTIDYIEDFKLVKKIFECIYPKKKFFDLNDIIKFLKKNSELLKYNSHILRNASWHKSFKKDAKFKGK